MSQYLGRLVPPFPLRLATVPVDVPDTSGAAAAVPPQPSGRPNRLRRVSGDVTLTGRVVINIWRFLRSDIKTLQYTVHSLAGTMLNVSFPTFPLFTLASWWRTERPFGMYYRTIHYVLKYLQLSMKLLDVTDALARSEELARFLGTDLWSTIARGSQHRIEALLVRTAHSLGYLLLTASKQQVRNQPALMAIPLVLEPESAFYWWPVAVLDFRSLYPSLMIAYNLCYTTCLGRLHRLVGDDESTTTAKTKTGGGDRKPLGVYRVHASTSQLQLFERELQSVEPTSTCPVIVSPDETVYATRSIRRGIVPALIEEVISSRVVTKEGMKLLDPQDLKLKRLLNHRQYGLKMFANCTYGYCGATYSGRMPCSEIADSIVQTARRTLERSMAYIEAHPRWKARVVYGDTDSLFVHLEGRTVEKAFVIGNEIVNEISAINPWPVELELEKVYCPCCLQTKKRYVGYAYTEPKGPPKLDSKGIETIRRDQCPAVSNALRDALSILFRTRDISQMRRTLQQGFYKLLLGEPYTPFADYMFLRDVRLGTYAFDRGGPAHTLPPQGVVSYAMLYDWRATEEVGEGGGEQETALTEEATTVFDYKTRIPYVVVQGPPGSRLIDLVVPPYREQTVSQPLCPLSPVFPQLSPRHFTLWTRHRPLVMNAEWYIVKQIVPVLQRMFTLVDPPVNVARWVSSMPKPADRRPPVYPLTSPKKPVPTAPLDHPPLKTALAAAPASGRAVGQLLPPSSGVKDRPAPSTTTQPASPEYEVIDLAISSPEEEEPKEEEPAAAPIQPSDVLKFEEEEALLPADTFLTTIAASEAGVPKKPFVPVAARRRRPQPPITPIENTVTLFSFLPSTAQCHVCGRSLPSRAEDKSNKSVKEPEKKEPELSRRRSRGRGRRQTSTMRPPSPKRAPAPVLEVKPSQPNIFTEETVEFEGHIRTFQHALCDNTAVNSTPANGHGLASPPPSETSATEPAVVLQRVRERLCAVCVSHPRDTLWKIATKRNALERRATMLLHLCIHCTGSVFAAEACHDAFHCPVYPKKIQCRNDLAACLQDIEDLRTALTPNTTPHRPKRFGRTGGTS